MHLYITFISFILGLVLASFFNALLYRIDKEYKYPDIFIKNSHCEKCNKQLQWYELIPILSFVIFKGKCRKCNYKVPIYYLLSELFLGIGFASLYYNSLPWYYYITTIFLFSLSYFDRIYKGIPKTLTHIFLAYGFITLTTLTILNGGIVNNALLISVGLTALLFLLGKMLKKPFGFGDILVLLTLGFLLTISQYIIFVYIFFFITGFYSITMLVLKKLNTKSKIPLLPFLFTAFIFTILLESYLGFFLKLFGL